MFRVMLLTLTFAAMVGMSIAGSVAISQRHVDQHLTIAQAFRGDLARWRGTVDTQLASYDARLEAIEKTVYGDKSESAKATPTVIGPQVWQRNRDRELRARILALERRLYSCH